MRLGTVPSSRGIFRSGRIMARKAPTQPVLRALFVLSRNQCAFPGCNYYVLINDKDQFVGQICHIEVAEPGDERYNPGSDDEYRRSQENLLL